jgi:hypothetical protein
MPNRYQVLSAARFVFSLVPAIGAFDGEHFPVISSGLPLRYTPEAADGMLHQIKGRLSEENRRKYAECEVYRL